LLIGGAHFVVGDLRAWGWTMTIIGAVQLLAAVGVWAGNQLARWPAVAVVALNAIAKMFFIPAYPFWSLVIIAMDVVALWGLACTAAARTWAWPSLAARRAHRAGRLVRCRVWTEPADRLARVYVGGY
jgi:hypothetical protein